MLCRSGDEPGPVDRAGSGEQHDSGVSVGPRHGVRPADRVALDSAAWSHFDAQARVPSLLAGRPGLDPGLEPATAPTPPCARPAPVRAGDPHVPQRDALEILVEGATELTLREAKYYIASQKCWKEEKSSLFLNLFLRVQQKNQHRKMLHCQLIVWYIMPEGVINTRLYSAL